MYLSTENSQENLPQRFHRCGKFSCEFSVDKQTILPDISSERERRFS